MTHIIETNWYDYPQYYDLAFRADTRMEADFIEAACRKYCPFRAKRLFEPACGTGRLITELAARGYRMTGLDLCAPPLDYLQRRLKRRRLRADLLQADMTDFHLPKPVDAAFCMVNSFRHLLTEQAARQHLQCMANHLRPGGIYILAMHLLPPDASEECIERWREQQGQTRVSVTLRVLSASRRQRIENLRVSLLVRDREKVLRLRHDFPFRMYTPDQFRRLLRSVPLFEFCDVYDFWYEIDHPFRFNDDLADSVFVLRRK